MPKKSLPTEASLIAATICAVGFAREILRPPKDMASEHCAVVAPLEIMPLISPRDAKVGSFPRPGNQAHRRSLVVWKSPWSIVPLYPDAKIDDEFSKNVIDLEVRHWAVLTILHGPDYDRLLANFFREHSVREEQAELEEEITVARSHYICFNVADFISALWTSEPFAYHLYLKTTWKLLANMEGVFQCNAETNSESHSFVIWNDKQTVRYYSGYGGFESPIYEEFPIQDWFDLLQKAVGARDNTTRWKSLKRAFALPPLFDELYPQNKLIRLQDDLTIVVLA